MELKGGHIIVIGVDGFYVFLMHPVEVLQPQKVSSLLHGGEKKEVLCTYNEIEMLNCDSCSDIQTWPGVFLTHHVLLGSDCTQPWASSTHVRESRGGQKWVSCDTIGRPIRKKLQWGHGRTLPFPYWLTEGSDVSLQKKNFWILWPKPKRNKKHFSDRLLLLSLFWR